MVTMAAPVRFNVSNHPPVVRHHNHAFPLESTVKSGASYASSNSLDNRRLSNWRNTTTTTTTAKCNAYTHPKLCDFILNRPTCSCDNDIGAYYCCQRAIVVVHKMGVTAVQSLKDLYFLRQMRRSVQTPEITSHGRYGSLFRMMYESPQHVDDYRQVVVTRNWYDSIISGYLYHRSGKECWLDWFGQPNHTGWLLRNQQEDWERRLLRPSDNAIAQLNITWNPGNGRDLCRYLADEPVAMGLRVYMAWAMTMYMNPLLEFRKARQEREEQNGWNRTKYVCYEELTDTNMHSDVFHGMAHWLFPDRNVTFNMTTTARGTDSRQAGHATDQDPQLRSRLRRMIKQIDAEVFGKAIEQGNAYFRCGPD